MRDIHRTRVSVWTSTGRFVRSLRRLRQRPRPAHGSPAGRRRRRGLRLRRRQPQQPRREVHAGRPVRRSRSARARPSPRSPTCCRPRRGVTVAADGTIYATDEYLRRVQHYSADGAFLGSFGSMGSGDGQFSAPGGHRRRPGQPLRRRLERLERAALLAGRWLRRPRGQRPRQRAGPVLPSVLRGGRLPRDPVRRRRRQQPHPAPGRARRRAVRRSSPTTRPSGWW